MFYVYIHFRFFLKRIKDIPYTTYDEWIKTYIISLSNIQNHIQNTVAISVIHIIPKCVMHILYSLLIINVNKEWNAFSISKTCIFLFHFNMISAFICWFVPRETTTSRMQIIKSEIKLSANLIRFELNSHWVTSYINSSLSCYIIKLFSSSNICSLLFIEANESNTETYASVIGIVLTAYIRSTKNCSNIFLIRWIHSPGRKLFCYKSYYRIPF